MVCELQPLRKNICTFFAHQVQKLFGYIMNTVPAHEVLPGLWLGNARAARDREWLAQNQITVIFNCTKDIPFLQRGPSHMYRIPLDDNLEADEIRNLELWSWEVSYKLAKERVEGNKILVHCAAGMQRSAAVIAIYLISAYRCTTDEAIAYIKSKRPVAFFGNANFYNSIKGFEKSFRNMIAEKDAYAQYPRIPLPIDPITNT
jgi:protein-tyrosine phosphatase